MADHACGKAASAIEALKMESPLKKLDLGAADKENQPFDEAAVAAVADQVDANHRSAPKQDKLAAKEEKPVASALKLEETDEPLLQDNPQRFVLFPIKYHEVCHASWTRQVAHRGRPLG